MSRRFVTLDVFTTQPHAGNPLAVVLDGEGLDSAAMQTIAREFNLSETVFVFPPENPGHRAAIRIFTPGAELPFAGHPTVGTAVWLVLSDEAEVQYKVSTPYNAATECSIRWNDPELGVAWPVTSPVLSERDKVSESFAEFKARLRTAP